MEQVFCTKRSTEAETPHSRAKRDCLFAMYYVCRSKCAQICHCGCSRRGTATRPGVSWQSQPTGPRELGKKFIWGGRRAEE